MMADWAGKLAAHVCEVYQTAWMLEDWSLEVELATLLRKVRADAIEEAAKVAERRGRQMANIGTTPSRKIHLEWSVQAYMDAAGCIRCLKTGKA
jgi:hypothetical protein